MGLGDKRVKKKQKKISPSFFIVFTLKLIYPYRRPKVTMSHWPILLHTIWFNFFRCLPHPEAWYTPRTAKVTPEPAKLRIKMPRTDRYAPDKT
jgi:hypothetical protein